jgi:proteasome assembly chaperone (PAC2) family protein
MINKSINLRKEPIRKPCDLLASWPGIGNVSLIIATYIKDKLKAEEIGEIEPFEFFDPIGVMVRDNVIEAPQFPQSKFYYWNNPKSERDLILLISDEQPGAKGYDLANTVLDACKKLKVKRVYTCAAAIARIHHTETPKVWGAATTRELLDFLKTLEVILRGDIQIAGMNGLFLGAAKEREVEGICLLGEVPMYTTRIPNPKASLAILKVLMKALGIEIDLADLTNVARQAEDEMKRLAAEAMQEFITSYTKPVWPQEESEEGDTDDDEEEEEDDEIDEEHGDN